MNTDTFSVRLDHEAKARLQKLAKTTGRSRSFLAAEAIVAYTRHERLAGRRNKQGSHIRSTAAKASHTRASANASCTLLIDFDSAKMLACLKVPPDKLAKRGSDSATQRVVTMREIIGDGLPDLEPIYD